VCQIKWLQIVNSEDDSAGVKQRHYSPSVMYHLSVDPFCEAGQPTLLSEHAPNFISTRNCEHMVSEVLHKVWVSVKKRLEHSKVNLKISRRVCSNGS
jgi:hypothetical protein